ncbi:hypothetical protein QR98_0009350 [Sarcoptes scabiei]|uniref:Uncharacterized protein n=1 Tax=Sarcoptes scabiei TaxID=52283 RepID=A0A131ZWN6_SARSC|nr:hypothetical protein QR98_0009350 [Sarcoptes scabiei]
MRKSELVLHGRVDLNCGYFKIHSFNSTEDLTKKKTNRKYLKRKKFIREVPPPSLKEKRV